MMKNTTGQYNVITQICEYEYFSFMRITDFHGVLFLWQQQHFMNMECLSDTVTMAAFTRFLLKLTASLIDNICYYASCMNEPSLTIFKCVLLNISQNVVESLLSAEGPNVSRNQFPMSFC